MPETLVLCGGVAPQRRRGEQQVLRLDVGARAGRPGRVNLNIDHLSARMVEQVPDRLTDLLEIACYVFCSDQFIRRGTLRMSKMGEDWRRRFRFVIPVRDTACWTRDEVRGALIRTLSFLSEDEFAFEFFPSEPKGGLQSYLDLQDEDAPAGFAPDRIVLFSGGLDSLTGAAEALLRHDERVALVSHQSSHMVQSRQTELVQHLRQRTRPRQLLHIGVGVNTGAEEALEFTQRSRSFLFAAMGFVVARLFGKSEICMYENGPVSLNLPLSEHVLGSRSTRTTHPRFISDVSRFLTLLAEQPVSVENPYFWMTKPDILRRLAEVECAELIARSISCTRVRQATRSGRHCGRCSQCLDRRFAVLAACLEEHEPAGLYDTDLFLGERKPGPDLTLAEAYIFTASRLATMTELGFLARYGQVYRALPYLDGTADENATRLHLLHARHGKEVLAVVDRELAKHASLDAILSLPAGSLLSMIQSRPTQSFLDPIESEPAASEQPPSTMPSELEWPIRLALDEVGKRIVFPYGIVLSGASYGLVAALLPAFQEGQTENCQAEQYRYVPSPKLARSLDIEEQTLRRRITRMKKDLELKFAAAHRRVAMDDVVQNKVGKGYRLNPFLTLTSPALLEQTARPGHSAPAPMSQPTQ